MNSKKELTITSDLESFEQAKELLADLEVLKEKYVVNAVITIYPQVNFEEFGVQN